MDPVTATRSPRPTHFAKIVLRGFYGTALRECVTMAYIKVISLSIGI